MSTSAAFHSILFLDDAALDQLEHAHEPAYFHDLNLNQLIDEMCSGHARAKLEPYFWTTLNSVEEVDYRQAAMRECERPEVDRTVRRFVHGLDHVRRQQSLLAQVRYLRQRQRCLLDSAAAYCQATSQLADDVEALDLQSPALRSLCAYVAQYTRGPDFRDLIVDVERTQRALASVHYLLHIHSHRIRVQRYEELPDLGSEVGELFAQFREHGKPTGPVTYRGSDGFSHIDAAVLNQVAAVFPEPFGLLATFFEKHGHFVDTVVARLGREAEFVLACLEFKDRLADRGLAMCYPTMVDRPSLLAEDSYDAALAARVKGASIVTNTLTLSVRERVIVVTGPNQGGKTTVARTFGQLHHLAAIGAPVAASNAEIFLPDRIFAQFERQEDPGSQRGKLQDDLIRMREVFEEATPSSLIILNEVFSSTATEDALILAQRMLDEILDRGCLSICVTFLDELASYHPNIVSMVAQVDPDDPGARTYKVARRQADGRAYAEAIARKYHLSHQEIMRRVLRCG